MQIEVPTANRQWNSTDVRIPHPFGGDARPLVPDPEELAKITFMFTRPLLTTVIAETFRSKTKINIIQTARYFSAVCSD